MGRQRANALWGLSSSLSKAGSTVVRDPQDADVGFRGIRSQATPQSSMFGSKVAVHGQSILAQRQYESIRRALILKNAELS